MKTYYSIDRTPPGPVKLEAWTVFQARKEWVQADPNHREAITVREAGALCRDLHGCSLSEAVARGLV